MWVILALITLLFWSGSDIFSKLGCQYKKELAAPLKMVIAVGLVMGLHAAYEIFIQGTVFSLDVVKTYMPASILYIVSMAIGYFGLRYIELSISSPICNTSGALVVIFYLIRGERPASSVLIGVAFTLIGILAIGFAEYTEDEEAREERQKASNMRYTKSFIAILLPLLYCLIDALGTYADALILETKGIDEAQANVAYEVTFFTVGLVVFISLVIRGQFKASKSDAFKLTAATMETVGQFAYIYAISTNAIMAAPVISCYCVLTVVWSRLLLKERLSLKHYLGILAAFIGIIILASSGA